MPDVVKTAVMKAIVQSPLDALAQPMATSSRLLDQVHHIDWAELGAEWGLKLGGGLLLLATGLWLAKWSARLLSRLFQRFGVDEILTSFLANIARAIIWIVVFIATLDYVGIPTTSLLAVVGAAGLGIGLALKDSLSNIASGVMLIALRPFRAGDQVQVASLTGIVEHVRIFQTVLRTFDNRVMILPNSLITGAPITNFTARDTRRVDLTVGIGYDDNIGRARDMLIAAAKANSRVLADPAPDVLVSELAESSVNLILRAWVATRDYGLAKSELTEAARVVLGEGGISIPFPQRDMHMYHHGVADARQGEKALAPPSEKAAPKAASQPSGADVARNDDGASPTTPET